VNVWQTIGIVLLTWAFAAGLNWGIFSERLRSIGFRVEEALRKIDGWENVKGTFLTRSEYEVRNRELRDLVGDTRHRDNLIVQGRIMQTLSEIQDRLNREREGDT